MSEDKGSLEKLIAEAAVEAATAPPQEPRRAVRGRPIVLGAVFVLLVIVLGGAWKWQQRMSAPDEAELENGRRLGLNIAAEMIHDFTRRNGRYPDSLAEAVPIQLDIRYRKVEGGFELDALAPDGREIVLRDQ